MAIVSGLCNGAKRDFLLGVHAPNDHYKIALYTASATLSPETEFYTPNGEILGKGYERGGQALQGYRCGLDGPVAVLGWTENLLWKNASISAYGALIYNASKGNRAIVVVDFGKRIESTDGDWRLLMPPVSAETAPVRIF